MTIHISYYKVAAEVGSKFVPQNIPIAQFDPHLPNLRSNAQLFYCKPLTVPHHVMNVVRAIMVRASKWGNARYNTRRPETLSLFFSPQPKKELKTEQSRVGLDLDPAEALSALLSTAYSLLFFYFYFSAWSWLFVLEYSIRSLLSFKRKAISVLFFLFTIVDIRNLFV